jgi:predicted DNA-binding transcriptional regulator AlpA
MPLPATRLCPHLTAVAVLSPAELAERYDVPLETVYGWNKTRTGPRFMKIGRHVRYRLADVIAWENSRAVASGRTA